MNSNEIEIPQNLADSAKQIEQFFLERGIKSWKLAGIQSRVLSDSDVEPKTGSQIGVWFNDETVWMYRGTLPIVIEFHPREGGFIGNPIIVSRCPSCEMSRIKSANPYAGKVKRWMILPA